MPAKDPIKGNTTIAITSEVHLQLDEFCKKNKITKKDFVAASVRYFNQYGINPLVHESPTKEMDDLIKRVNQIIAFIKKQESDILRPMLAGAVESEANVKCGIISLAKNISDIEKSLSQIKFSLSTCANHQDILKMEQKMKDIAWAQSRANEYIASLIDAKNKSGIFSDLATTYEAIKRDKGL